MSTLIPYDWAMKKIEGKEDCLSKSVRDILIVDPATLDELLRADGIHSTQDGTPVNVVVDRGNLQNQIDWLMDFGWPCNTRPRRAASVYFRYRSTGPLSCGGWLSPDHLMAGNGM